MLCSVGALVVNRFACGRVTAVACAASGKITACSVCCWLRRVARGVERLRQWRLGPLRRTRLTPLQ